MAGLGSKDWITKGAMGGDDYKAGRFHPVEKTRDTRQPLPDQDPPQSYVDAKNFRESFTPGSLERRLLGYEKSWRHPDDWQHMPYHLSGEAAPTIGYGHYLHSPEERAKYGFEEDKLHPQGRAGGKRREYGNMRIPESTAQRLFAEDVSRSKQEAIRVAGQQGVMFDTLPQQSQQALSEMVYQMGASSVNGFPSMWEGYRNGDLGRVQSEMLNSDWHHNQTPVRAKDVTSLLNEVEELPYQDNPEADKHREQYARKQAAKRASLSSQLTEAGS